MKYSVKETQTALGKTWQITLNGMPVFVVQSADDEAGTVEAPLIKPDGRAVFDHGRGRDDTMGDYAIVSRSGKVEITLVDFDGKIDYPKSYPNADHPFRIENAKPGELSSNWDKPRFRSS
jgi:hypothetical protein